MHRNISIDPIPTNKDLNNLIQSAVNENKLILIIGPTGVGKSDLAIKIARHISGEIISADAYQVYRYMNIGTAKVPHSEQKGIPHHLIDIIEPDTPFTVADFLTKTRDLIPQIQARGRTPILCGGTGLYCRAFLYEYTLDAQNPPPSPNDYEAIYHHQSNDTVWSTLHALAPDIANTIHPNNRKRVLRALFKYQSLPHLTTATAPDNAADTEPHQRNDTLIIGITDERQTIYTKINERVDSMIQNGLIDEVNDLQTRFPTADQALQALGYKEVLLYLNGSLSKDAMIELIKQKTRHFAKRQYTWFKRFNNVNWIHRQTALDYLTASN